ncbi:hypothetical protein BD413DRAFT_608365 [Trametes elegans]|nr:hypothetical protein BD413DRAFT_608365 [Trametes elegans]
MDTNFWGTVVGTREASRFFREGNPPGVVGRVIQVSSMRGVFDQPVYTFYCATMFGSMHSQLSTAPLRASRKELDPSWNIKPTCFAPGHTASAGHQKEYWTEPHPAYTDPALPSNQMRGLFRHFVPPGDTCKVMQRCYDLARSRTRRSTSRSGDDALGLVKKEIETMDKYASLTREWSKAILAVVSS